MPRGNIDLLHLVIGTPDPKNLEADPEINIRARAHYLAAQKGDVATARDCNNRLIVGALTT